MILCPPTFTQTLEAGRRTFIPPQGAQGGVIHYVERVRPVRRFRTIVKQQLAQDARFAKALVSAPEPILTVEGEYAALAMARATYEGNLITRHIGAVYGDDFLNVIDAVAESPQLADWFGQLTRYLVYHCQLGLGVRSRRYYYQPPAGWSPRAEGLSCTWYPREFPRSAVALIVPPAMPREGTVDQVWTSLLQSSHQLNFVIEQTDGPEPFTSEHGLHGKTWCLSGRLPEAPQSFRDLVILADERYQYALMLESGATDSRERCRAILPAVARSIRPIPTPQQPVVTGKPASFSFLAD